VIDVRVNGLVVSAEDGEPLLDVLDRAGAPVPTLCHDDRLETYGGCRLCLVQVEGQPRPIAACAARAAEGMAVSTEVPIREAIVEMLLTEQLEPSPGGRPNELLQISSRLGASPPFAFEPRAPHVDANALLGFDPNACILCTRCVRYAQDVMQCGVLTLAGRGDEARVEPAHGKAWLDTECELCGGCLSVCPTGAIYERKAQAVRERDLQKVRTTCPYCGVGCQIDLNVDPRTKRIVKVTSRPEYEPNRGDLCVKGRFATSFVHSPDRLTKPLVRGADGKLHEASWDEALAAAAAGLEGVKERHGAQGVGVISSARLTMEENYLTQKLARAVIGTNSVHSCEGT
jgi:predicted molibdopterin-dependent oxidoreductase YjgC